MLKKLNNNLCINSLFKLFNLELAFARISGWLREMGGKNTEKGRSIHSYYFKLDGTIINYIFQTIFGNY